MRYLHFSKSERLELSILLKKGYSIRDIAQALGRNPSSVSREIKNNSVKGRYDPLKAGHKAYWKRWKSKYQGMKVRENPEIERYVHEKAQLYWSPEKISGRLKRETQGRLSVKTDTIYKYLYSPYGYHLCGYLKSKRQKRKKRKGEKHPREIIKNRVFIDQRPVVVHERGRYGDFECDTMGRPRYASQHTLVVARERKSRYLLARKVVRLKYAMDGLRSILNPLPVRSATFDNGVENARYEELGISAYFCHPYSSWEKGSVEQGIGLIRWFIPKKADLKHYSNKNIASIIETINNMPMKCLDYQTPKEVFEEQYLKQSLASECCT